MKRAKKAPRRENQAQARASSLDRGRENRICAMLMVSAEEAAFKAIENEKSEKKKPKMKAIKVEHRANGGMAEACPTF